MTKDAPAFDFFPERWLAGVAALSDAEQLAYLRLLCHQWLSGDDGLPDDLAKLKRLAGKGVTDELLEKFPASDGKRRNAKLESIRQDQRQRIAKSRDKIAKMNAARDAKKHPQDAHQGSLQEALVEGQQDPSCRLPHHSPLTTHPSTTAKAVGRIAPRSPQLPDEDWLKSLEADPTYEGLNIRQELGKMQRWCAEKHKQPSRARFVNWINRAEKPMAAQGTLPLHRPRHQAYDATAATEGKTAAQIGTF